MSVISGSFAMTVKFAKQDLPVSVGYSGTMQNGAFFEDEINVTLYAMDAWDLPDGCNAVAVEIWGALEACVRQSIVDAIDRDIADT